MKHLIAVVFLLFNVFVISAQDEGAIKKRERIERDKSIFVGGGISILGGSNLGSYSTGINFEGGFNKRLNRVFSIGASLSYVSFKYDPNNNKGKPASVISNDLQNWYWDEAAVNAGGPVTDLIYAPLKGGDVSLVSLALNLKVNFVPVRDNSVISVYGFAKPFIANASISELSSSVEYYDEVAINSNSDIPTSITPVSYQEPSKITGGIFIGPGVEFFPAKPFSFFIQASFGYTFPINLVSLGSYGNDIVKDLSNDAFPFKSLGFTSINFAGGISFNID